MEAVVIAELISHCVDLCIILILTIHNELIDSTINQ